MTIKEVIVVEGRDDESAVKAALPDAEIIVTHGYGISEGTWKRLERAYRGPGIIIFTDPDYAGERIRSRIASRFPSAGHAFLSRDDAEKDGDIGIENASADAIRLALEKMRHEEERQAPLFTYEDLLDWGLAGTRDAALRRDKLGKALGIGYGNSKKFLSRLNRYGITREEFLLHGKALFAGGHKSD